MIVGLIIGLFVGALLGILVFGMLIGAGEADRADENYDRGYADARRALERLRNGGDLK